ncbi:hypothetical protein MPTK1_1g22230 [Marchantia polymorpha subsp. ruderalis]|uniref:Uncharacterized protein n=2 Tax=Marchantia polymorpha TaxID=3197 RepID=A0AAF6AT19_MARPO|nr:hypothetical protein MARPO_0001s0561 [Marchantia polymorpha]BBM99589.1 hypothetical protein Mp_1g22230 [Marchantia polymorpha subsp. ruderalis]|eukprot:PTQ50677.1 hypothetical protein MARPO_0001s0561 [Marchantia polymorpha]
MDATLCGTAKSRTFIFVPKDGSEIMIHEEAEKTEEDAVHLNRKKCPSRSRHPVRPTVPSALAQIKSRESSLCMEDSSSEAEESPVRSTSNPWAMWVVREKNARAAGTGNHHTGVRKSMSA